MPAMMNTYMKAVPDARLIETFEDNLINIAKTVNERVCHQFTKGGLFSRSQY